MSDLEQWYSNVLQLAKRWKKWSRWGKYGTVAIFFAAGIIAFTIMQLSGQTISSDGDSIVFLITAILIGAVPLFISYVVFSVFISGAQLSLKNALIDYNRSIQQYCIEDKLTRQGVRHAHFRRADGIWPSDVVRSGLIQKKYLDKIQTDSYVEGVLSGQKFRFSFLNVKVFFTEEFLNEIHNGRTEDGWARRLFSQRIETSKEQTTQNEYFNGQFWALQSNRQFPCRVLYLNNAMKRLMSNTRRTELWCISDGAFEPVEIHDPFLMKEGICLCDDRDLAEEVLTDELKAKIREYGETHPDEAFFMSFVNREIFFFDYSEDGNRFMNEGGLFVHTKENMISDACRQMKSMAETSCKTGTGISKYLFEIMEIFQDEGVMWSSGGEEPAEGEIDQQMKVVNQQLLELQSYCGSRSTIR